MLLFDVTRETSCVTLPFDHYSTNEIFYTRHIAILHTAPFYRGHFAILKIELFRAEHCRVWGVGDGASDEPLFMLSFDIDELSKSRGVTSSRSALREPVSRRFGRNARKVGIGVCSNRP